MFVATTLNTINTEELLEVIASRQVMSLQPDEVHPLEDERV
jgi:hypothetical protein